MGSSTNVNWCLCRHSWLVDFNNIGNKSCMQGHDSCLSLAVLAGVLGSLLAITLLIIIGLIVLLFLQKKRVSSVFVMMTMTVLDHMQLTGYALTGAASEVAYDYPEMSPRSLYDPKMENCAAYGVINTGRL